MSTKTLQSTASPMVETVRQWNAEYDQKNADLADVKAKATEEFLNGQAPLFESKSFKYAKTPQPALSDANKKAIALKEKDKGNEYFSKAQYTAAIEHYTEAIKYDATNTACFANRALCYIKTERWIKAIEDCNVVLKIDPNYVKAYLRRGLAYKNSQKLSLALLDYNKVLSLEPANKEAASELKAVKDLLAKEEQQHKATENKLDVNNKQKLPGDNQTVKTQAPVLEKKADVFLQQVKSEKKSGTSDVKESDKSLIQEDHKQHDTAQSTDERKQEDKSTPLATTLHAAPLIKSSALPALIPTAVPEQAPKHYYEFERSWNSLKDDNTACYKYFKLIKPEAYPALFKEAMTSELLLAIWQLLLESSFPNDVDFALQAMKCLPKLSRFDMLLLFLEKKEKQVLEELWQRFVQCNVDAKVLSAVKALYR